MGPPQSSELPFFDLCTRFPFFGNFFGLVQNLDSARFSSNLELPNLAVCNLPTGGSVTPKCLGPNPEAGCRLTFFDQSQIFTWNGKS